MREIPCAASEVPDGVGWLGESHRKGLRQRRCFDSMQIFLLKLLKTYPATSRTTSRTKAVRFERWPLVLETRGLLTRAVVFYKVGKIHCQRPSSAEMLFASMHLDQFENEVGAKAALRPFSVILHFSSLQEQPHRGSRDPPRGETVTRTWPLFWPTARPVLAVALAIVYYVGNSVGRLSSEIVVVVKGKVGKRDFALGGGPL